MEVDDFCHQARPESDVASIHHGLQICECLQFDIHKMLLRPENPQFLWNFGCGSFPINVHLCTRPQAHNCTSAHDHNPARFPANRTGLVIVSDQPKHGTRDSVLRIGRQVRVASNASSGSFVMATACHAQPNQLRCICAQMHFCIRPHN